LPVAPLRPARPVRSFVRREGRMTPAQRRALEDLWPVYGIDGGIAPLDWEMVFGDLRPVTLEIGFGDGESLRAMAQEAPGAGFIGIDPHRPGAGRFLRDLAHDDIQNVRVIVGDAAEVIPKQVPPASLDRILVFFPDPWPKKRHHKRRLLSEAFLKELADRLKSGGSLQVATDWPEYGKEILAAIDQLPTLENTAGIGTFSPRPAWRPLTKYERRGLQLGHSIFDIAAQRRP